VCVCVCVFTGNSPFEGLAVVHESTVCEKRDLNLKSI
jgi:hypothetical protein